MGSLKCMRKRREYNHMYQNIGSQRHFLKACKQNVCLNYELNYISIDLRRVLVRWGWWRDGKTQSNPNTSIHTAQCHQDASESCGSWPWHRAQRTSCHWGSKYRAPTADRPRGCPVSGSVESPSTRDACPAMPAGNTWSGCSPVNGREKKNRSKENSNI